MTPSQRLTAANLADAMTAFHSEPTLGDAYGDKLPLILVFNPEWCRDTPVSVARAWLLREILEETDPAYRLILQLHASALEPEGVQ